MSDDGLGGLEGKGFDELYKYYREMFQQVTEDSVTEWEKKYPGSSMEKEDLIDFYNKFQGDMKNVHEFIPFVEEEDLSRSKQVVDELIEAGELKVLSSNFHFCGM
jgi:DnaJ family protein C protein 9